jgi:hypothetical protein
VRSGGGATVNLHVRAGYEARFGTCEIGGQRRNLRAGSIAAQSDRSPKLLSDRAFGRMHVRGDSSRVNIVDSNSTRTEIACKAACQAGDRTFRHGVDGRVRHVGRCYVFHTANAYELDDGAVIVDVVVYPRLFDKSRQDPENTATHLERWLLDAASGHVQRHVFSDCRQEFPRFR